MCRKLISTKKAGAIFDGDPAGRKKLRPQKYNSNFHLSIDFQKKFRRVGALPANRVGRKAS